MLLEVLVFLLLGILAGIFTGLMPGIHINLVGAFIVYASLSFLFKLNELSLIVLIVSMSITHVFIDFIPSIFLGAPEDGTELSVLPGHELLSRGLGLQAVRITSLGCLYGILAFFALLPLLYFLVEKISKTVFIPKIIPFFLILICISLVLVEKNKLKALEVFFISGVLGLLILNSSIKEPLLPLLTGLFGTSSMILSLNSKIDLKKQVRVFDLKLEKLKPILTAMIFSPLSIFLPAISGGQIATIGNQFSRLDRKGFLFLLGAINSLGMAFSFLALFLLGKTRTGSAAAIKSLLGVPSFKIFFVIALTILVSGIISFIISKPLSEFFVSFLQKFEYKKTSIATIFIIAVITFLASELLGVFALSISTLTGIYCLSRGVNRISMMSCLLLPTIVLYLF